MSVNGNYAQPISEVKTIREVNKKTGKAYFTEMRLRGKVYPGIEKDVGELDSYIRQKGWKTFVLPFKDFNIVGLGKSKLFTMFDFEELAWFKEKLENDEKIMYFDSNAIMIFLNKSCQTRSYTNFFNKLKGICNFEYLSDDVFEITLIMPKT